MEDVINTGQGVQAVGVGADDLYNGIFSVLIVEFLRGAVYFNILKIKPDFISDVETDSRLAVPISEFLLLLLCCGYCGLGLVPYLTQLIKDTLSYLDRRLTYLPELFRLEFKQFDVVSVTNKEGVYPYRDSVAVINY